MIKSISKRIRITSTGKILRRSMAIGHTRTRQSTKNVRNKRNTRTLGYTKLKILLHS
jgi:ribosomal protein L35